jgi:hypothetical protein
VVDPDELARRFRELGETQAARAPFSAAISAHIAATPDVAAILLAAPPEQQLPVLLLAALHHEVLADPHCELAQWYPTTSPRPLAGDVGPALLRHCRRRADELRMLVATRSTQTNEVGRCGFFLPPLGELHDELGPLALVDVGTSAGLNLQLDRYSYDYEPGGSVGGRSDVRLVVGTRGAVPVPGRIPVVTARVGIDREPLDVTDDDAARWLRACVWADQSDRFHRLEAAIAIARLDPPEIRRGDAVELLAPAVADASGSGHPVVLNSWVLNYLPPHRRADYVTELDRIGAERDVSWLFAESPAQADGLPFPGGLGDPDLTVLMSVTWRRGRRTVRHLGSAHPHGYWLHWAA